MPRTLASSAVIISSRVMAKMATQENLWRKSKVNGLKIEMEDPLLFFQRNTLSDLLNLRV